MLPSTHSPTWEVRLPAAPHSFLFRVTRNKKVGRRSDRLSLWLGVAAVAGWWLSGLFWLCFVQALCD